MTISDKKFWVPVLLGTAVAVNLMLGGLLVARQLVVLPKAAPAAATSAEPALRTEFQLEWVGSSTEGDWRVEHFRNTEVRLDGKGKIVEKHPTSEMTYVRYWNRDKQP